MARSIQIQIPKPCQEDWDTMTAAQQGRFCSSCSKIVVDFSTMSDAQVLAWFSKAPAGACGKFIGEQLNRELVRPIERKPGWLRHFMALLFPALLLSSRSSGQKLHIAGDSIVSVPPRLPLQPLTGMLGGVTVGKMAVARTITLKGKVSDQSGVALDCATVMIKGSSKGTVTDKDGEFMLECKRTERITLVASYIGYEPQEINLNTGEKKSADFIMIPMTKSMMGDVIIVGYTVKSSAPVKKDSLFSRIGIFGPRHTVRLYPNPLPAGASLTLALDVSQAGEYMFTLSDLSGRAILQKEIYIETKNGRQELPLGGQVRAGIYAAELMNAAGKRVYAGKLLVQ